MDDNKTEKEDVTAHIQAEEALKQSEAKYRRLYNETPVLLHSIDMDGVVVEVNDHWLKTMGYERDEVIGRKVTDFYTDASKTYFHEVVRPAFLSNGIAKEIPYQFIKKNGDVIDVLLSATAERDAAGNVVRSQAVIENVTERKRIQIKLQESETRFQRLVEQSPLAISIIDRSGRIDYTNRKHSEIVGYSVKDFATLEEWWALVYPDAEERQRIMTAWEDLSRRILGGEDVGTIERTIACKNGMRKDVEMRFSLTGEKILTFFVDITRRKKAEEKLRQSEERFKAITMTASDAILLMDDQGKIVYWNPAAERIFGYSADEAIGKDLHLFLAPLRLHNGYQEGFAKFVVTGQGPVVNRSVEMDALRKNGAEFPIEVSTSAMNIGGRWHALGIVRDITERKRAEQVLRENQARLDLALQSARMGVWFWNITEDLRYFDDVTCQLLGIDPKQFTGTGEEFFRAVHPDDVGVIRTSLRRTIETGLLYEASYRVIWPDGSLHYISSRGRLVRNEEGQPVRINGILWDITDHRLMELDLIKSQKLESIGTLAGGIAHDFNNLLQGIFGYLSLAKMTIEQKDKALAMLDQAEKALHQTVNLTTQLLTFSKGGKPLKKAFNLRTMIEDAVRFSLSGSSVDHSLTIDKEIWPVDADEGQIAQVIQNMVINAEQSMPLGGVIEIAVRNAPAGTVAGLSNALPGDLVEITVRDQGTGIPPEHLPRIFDPYFTTKEKGSGLGLATSYSIIRNHGGVITVSSELGKGSCFKIYLPATSASPAQALPPQENTAGRKGRMLVMDDEEIVRKVAGALISSLGHEVAFAEHGVSAITQYREAMNAGRPFDIVLLDLTIKGGMGGLETIQKLLEIDPEVKAVVSSGYSSDAGMSDYLSRGFKACLKKPYTIENLNNVLNEFLI